MGEFKQFRRSQIAELRPCNPITDIEFCRSGAISVSREDQKAGSPKIGDMIARNPQNHNDMWLVAAQYFADNFEPVPSQPEAAVTRDQLVRLIADHADKVAQPLLYSNRVKRAGQCADAILALFQAEKSDAGWRAAVAFIQWAMQEGPWAGGDLDGGSVQDKAESLGIVVKTKYNPEKHGQCHLAEIAPGDDWYVFAPAFLPAPPQTGDAS